MAAKEIRTQNGPKFLIFRLSENNDSERFGLEKSSSCGSIQRKYKSHRYIDTSLNTKRIPLQKLFPQTTITQNFKDQQSLKNFMCDNNRWVDYNVSLIFYTKGCFATLAQARFISSYCLDTTGIFRVNSSFFFIKPTTTQKPSKNQNRSQITITVRPLKFLRFLIKPFQF